MPLLSRLRRGKKSKGSNDTSKPAKEDGALDTSNNSDQLIGATAIAAAAESDAAAPTSSAAILRAIKSKSALQLQDKSRVDSGGNGSSNGGGSSGKKKPHPARFINKLSKRSGRGGKQSSSSKQTTQRSAQYSSGLSKDQLNVLRNLSCYMQEIGGEPVSPGTVHAPPSVPSSPSTQVTAPLSSSPSSLSFVPLISTPAAMPTATPAASPARSTKTTRTAPSRTPNRGNKMDPPTAVSTPTRGKKMDRVITIDSTAPSTPVLPPSPSKSVKSKSSTDSALEEYFQRQADKHTSKQNQTAPTIWDTPKNNTRIRQIPDGEGAGTGANGELNAAAKAADDAVHVAALNAIATANTNANNSRGAEGAQGDNEEQQSHFPDDQSVEVKLIGRSLSEIQPDKLYQMQLDKLSQHMSQLQERSEPNTSLEGSQLTLSNPNEHDITSIEDTTTSVRTHSFTETETDTEFGRIRTDDTTAADTSVTGRGTAASIKAALEISPLGEIGSRNSSIVSHLTTQDVDLTKDSQRSKMPQKSDRKKQKPMSRSRTLDTNGTSVVDNVSYDDVAFEGIEEYDGAADDMFAEAIDAMCCNLSAPTCLSHCHTLRQASSPCRGSLKNTEILSEAKGALADLLYEPKKAGETDEK